MTLLLLLVTACGGAPPPPPSPPLQGVVLVTIDTQRADRLGVYDPAVRTSPTLDALAADGVVFENATATCPATAPSVASILTGRHRATHGVRRNGGQLPRQNVTLAEALRAAGFRTAATIANPLLERAGFDQGFEVYGVPADITRGTKGALGGGALVRRAAALLDEFGDDRFFLWVHLMDPHGPYFPPPPYRRGLDPAPYRWPGDDGVTLGRGNYGYHLIPRYQTIPGEADPARYRARYDAEVRYTDDLVAGLIAALEARGLWDRVLFAVTADHGESLGERDVYFQHGWYVYEPDVHVPLVLRAPGRLPAGRRIAESVSLVDLLPSILDLADVPPPSGIEGESLRALVAGQDDDRTAVAQGHYGNRVTALRHGRWKYIYTPPPPVPSPAARRRPDGSLRDGRRRDGWRAHWPTAAREELYDLDADPAEAHDRSAEEPLVTARFRRKLRRWKRAQAQRAREVRRAAFRAARARQRATAPPVDPAMQRDLRALGYLD